MSNPYLLTRDELTRLLARKHGCNPEDIRIYEEVLPSDTIGHSPTVCVMVSVAEFYFIAQDEDNDLLADGAKFQFPTQAVAKLVCDKHSISRFGNEHPLVWQDHPEGGIYAIFEGHLFRVIRKCRKPA